VSIPSTVTSIGTYAFSNMYALKEMHVYATTPPTIAASNSLSSLYLYAVIFVPEGCLSAYKSTTTWSIYADNMLEDVEYTISDVDSSAFTTVDYRISTPTSFESQANGGQIINVSNYKRIEFFTTGTTTAAFLSSYDPTASLTSQRVTSSNISISYSREFHSSYNVPEGAQYFFINGSTPPPIFKAWTVVTT
jgi:hypothetical protein